MSSYMIAELYHVGYSGNLRATMARKPDVHSLEAFASRLRWTRVALGLRQNQIAKHAKVSAQAWNNAETGDNWIKIPNLIHLCVRFGLSTDWFLHADMSRLTAELQDAILAAEEEETAKSQKAPRRA